MLYPAGGGTGENGGTGKAAGELGRRPRRNMGRSNSSSPGTGPMHPIAMALARAVNRAKPEPDPDSSYHAPSHGMPAIADSPLHGVVGGGWRP